MEKNATCNQSQQWVLPLQSLHCQTINTTRQSPKGELLD